MNTFPIFVAWQFSYSVVLVFVVAGCTLVIWTLHLCWKLDLVYKKKHVKILGLLGKLVLPFKRIYQRAIVPAMFLTVSMVVSED